MFASLSVQENAPDEYNGYSGCNVARFVSSDTTAIQRLVDALETRSVAALNAVHPCVFSYGDSWISGEFWLSEQKRAVFLNAWSVENGIEIELTTSVYNDPLDHTSEGNTDPLFWLDFVQPMRALAAVMGQGRAA